MRLILLVTDLQRGGTPLRIARVARRLAASGVDVHVGCLAPCGPVARDLEQWGIPTFACGARGAWDARALACLARHVRRINPDLIHATLFHANVAARAVGVLLNVPVLTSTATIEVERPWHVLVERATAPFDHGHIVNSHAVAAHVVSRFGVPEERVFVVPPSLDPMPTPTPRAAARRTLGIPSGAFVVAWAGRFDPVKRLELLIACAEEPEAAAWRFVVVGDGDERASIARRLADSPARERVALLGWRDDVTAVLSGADAFLLTSLTEGVPNAVLEALACGVPVVATDLPTLREIYESGAPVLLAPGALPGMLVAELAFLHDHANIRTVFGEQALLWAGANLDPERTVRALLDVYDAVLARTPPS